MVVEKKKSGMPAQGKKTPRITRRDKRRRRAVGVKIELRGLWEVEEDRGESENGPENGL